MKGYSMNVEKYVDIDEDDIIEFIEHYATDRFKAELSGMINKSETPGVVDNLYDLQRWELLQKIYKLSSLEQLEIIYNELTTK